MYDTPLAPHLDVLLLVICTVILAFNLLLDSLHLSNLPLPLLLTHLALPSEQLVIRFAVTTSQTIPQRSILSVVVVEIPSIQLALVHYRDE